MYMACWCIAYCTSTTLNVVCFHRIQMLQIVLENTDASTFKQIDVIHMFEDNTCLNRVLKGREVAVSMLCRLSGRGIANGQTECYTLRNMNVFLFSHTLFHRN
jgi:hypothetical protein